MEKKERIATILCLADGFDWQWLGEQQRYHGVKNQEYYLRVAVEILAVIKERDGPRHNLC